MHVVVTCRGGCKHRQETDKLRTNPILALLKAKVVEAGYRDYIKNLAQSFKNEEIQSLAIETLELL